MLLWMLAVRDGSLLRIVRMSSVDRVELNTVVVTFWQLLQHPDATVVQLTQTKRGLETRVHDTGQDYCWMISLQCATVDEQVLRQHQ